MTDEIAAVAIHFLHQLCRFFFRFADAFQSADFLMGWGVDKNMEDIRAIPQNVGRTAPDDHAIAARSYIGNHSVQHGDHTVGVERLGIGKGESTLVTSPSVGLEEAV